MSAIFCGGADSALPFCRGFLCDFAERSRPFPTVCMGGFPCPPVNMYMILRREQTAPYPVILCDVLIFSARNRRWRRVCADSAYQANPAAWVANRGAFAKHATP